MISFTGISHALDFSNRRRDVDPWHSLLLSILRSHFTISRVLYIFVWVHCFTRCFSWLSFNVTTSFTSQKWKLDLFPCHSQNHHAKQDSQILFLSLPTTWYLVASNQGCLPDFLNQQSSLLLPSTFTSCHPCTFCSIYSILYFNPSTASSKVCAFALCSRLFESIVSSN